MIECIHGHSVDILFKTREHWFKESQEKQCPFPRNIFEVEKLSTQISEKNLILGETAVEQNANTSAIYHTGIDEITVFVQLRKHDNFTWCSWRIIISLPEKISVFLW